ncbi:MAG: DNA gyrase C-terminal beta-propeller domain-containing protein, partial [Pseudomonadota bacterium]|nr:DNA gyrase C-terminal beta-propeller domain-containing protein [Pseudomonadota bacterium]
SEPITVVLSQMGWVRAAKGHDIAPENLSYKAGDEYLAHAPGRSNQPVYFLDSQGKSYSLPAHSLPSARGQGEPLTGRLNPSPEAQFKTVVMAEDKQKILLTTDFGYGFITEAENLNTQYKAGKSLLSVPEGATILAPIFVPQFEAVESSSPLFDDYPAGPRLAVITTQGRMLCFHVSELPELAKGKGNKLIGIPTADVKSGEERVCAVAVVSEQDKLVIHAGKRHMSLKYKELEEYFGQRAQRGKKLPRGYQNVDLAVAESEAKE